MGDTQEADEVERCVHGLANCPPCRAATEPRWLPEYDDGMPVAMRWHPGTPFASSSVPLEGEPGADEDG